jgi:hypothetical protein
MKIINLLINEQLLKAEVALGGATADNIVQLCRDYLRMLSEYRDQLYELRGIPEINLAQSSSLGRELIEQSRNAVRAAVEITVREHNSTHALLGSFVSIKAHEAAETFNTLAYKDATNWETFSGGVCSANGTTDVQMTVEEAVETAGRLRRDAYVANKTTFLR